MKLSAIVDRVTPDVPDRDLVRRAVLETIAAIGWKVDELGNVREVWQEPTQRHVTYAGMRSRYRR